MRARIFHRGGDLLKTLNHHFAPPSHARPNFQVLRRTFIICIPHFHPFAWDPTNHTTLHYTNLIPTLNIWFSVALRAALHLEAGPIRCVRGLKSSLVIGQKVEIGPNPFTPRGRADLVV